MNPRTTWIAGSTAGFVLTGLLLALALSDAPAGLRTPLALIVFLAATGFAVTGPGSSLNPALRWALVPALSLSADLLLAVLLLNAAAFELPLFLALLLVAQAIGIAVHLGLARRAAHRPEEALA